MKKKSSQKEDTCMKILAVDYGDSRTGLATCDRTEFLTSPITPQITVKARDKVAAGAFYNITPRVRFGGEMTLESRGANPGSGRDSAMEPGVKIGSAFRF